MTDGQSFGDGYESLADKYLPEKKRAGPIFPPVSFVRLTNQPRFPRDVWIGKQSARIKNLPGWIGNRSAWMEK
jgi:hypothetical protein